MSDSSLHVSSLQTSPLCNTHVIVVRRTSYVVRCTTYDVRCTTTLYDVRRTLYVVRRPTTTYNVQRTTMTYVVCRTLYVVYVRRTTIYLHLYKPMLYRTAKIKLFIYYKREMYALAHLNLSTVSFRWLS